MKNKLEVTKISIQALADKFFTVPNTIIRLCKKMDYVGFSELKNTLRAELSLMDTMEHEEDCCHHIINIKKTIDLMDYELLEKINILMAKSSRTVFFTLGDNVNIIQGAIKELSLQSKHILFHPLKHDVLYDLTTFTSQDILFLVSLSGSNPELIELATLAKAKGAKVIALTHFENNPLQKVADLHLYCYAPQVNVYNYNVTDKTPLLLVLRALTENFWHLRGAY